MAGDKEGAKKQFVSFVVAGELFGIDIKLINEVNPNVHLVPIPLSDPYIRGHVNIRGQVILVIDLAVMFGKEPRAVLPESHIIIFKTAQDFLRLQLPDRELDLELFGDKPVAILVDMIGDVVTVPPEQIENPTGQLKNAYQRFIEGVLRLEDDLLIIINPEQVLGYKSNVDLKPE